MTIPAHIAQVYKNAVCLYSHEEILSSIDRVAREIEEKLSEKNPIVLGIMVGSIVFLGHLLPRLTFPLELDYLHATRYQGNTVGGELFWKAKPSLDLKGRTVLVVDDVLEGGITLAKTLDYIKECGAKEIWTAVLIDKQKARKPEGFPKADFTGLQAENPYIFGFGMDYQEYLRNVPGIYQVNQE
ncbi:MAG: hypoxanthine-guanine phosphoribosyltransferase [Proteobacteria bacterium]|nr:hypoxanthine-guanine phosphoribosyltransferase [Pseudomonadota bacterium]